MEFSSKSVYKNLEKNPESHNERSDSFGSNDRPVSLINRNLSDSHLVQSELFNIRETNHYTSSESLEDTYTGCFSSSIYAFKIQSVPISLPEDYKDCLLKITDTFAEKLTRLPGEMSQKIGKRIEKCSKAMNQVIYNLNINLLVLLNDLENLHNTHQIDLTNNLIEYLNKLLELSINELGMPQKVKRMFVIEVDLDSLKQPFIEKCMGRRPLTLDFFWEELQKDFSLFIKQKHQTATNQLKNMFQEFSQRIEKINNSLIENVRNLMFSILLTVNYQHVGFFASKFTRDLSYCASDWVLFASLILQSEPVTFHKPVSLSPSAILIPLTLSKETLFILFDKAQSSVIGRIESKNLLVASGSTVERIFISLNDMLINSEYLIQMGRLKQRSNFDMKLKFSERVTSSLFVQSQNKLIFIVNQNHIYSKKLDSDKNVLINFNSKNQNITSALYFGDSKLIGLKTSSFLFLFNEYFQLVQQVNVCGDMFESIFFRSAGVLWVFDKRKAVEFKFSQSKEVDNKRGSEQFEIGKCKYSISRDFLYSMPSGSKYIPFVQTRFSVPDANRDSLRNSSESNFLKRFELIQDKVEEESADLGVIIEKKENIVDQGVIIEEKEKIEDQVVIEEKNQKIEDQVVIIEESEKIEDQVVIEEKKQIIVSQGFEENEKIEDQAVKEDEKANIVDQGVIELEIENIVDRDVIIEENEKIEDKGVIIEESEKIEDKGVIIEESEKIEDQVVIEEKKQNIVSKGFEENEKIEDQVVKEEEKANIVNQGVIEIENIVDQEIVIEEYEIVKEKENIVDLGVKEEEKTDIIQQFAEKTEKVQEESIEGSNEFITNLKEPESVFIESDKGEYSEVEKPKVTVESKKELDQFEQSYEDVKFDSEEVKNEFTTEPVSKSPEIEPKENLEGFSAYNENDYQSKESEHKDQSSEIKEEFKEVNSESKSSSSKEDDQESDKEVQIPEIKEEFKPIDHEAKSISSKEDDHEVQSIDSKEENKEADSNTVEFTESKPEPTSEDNLETYEITETHLNLPSNIEKVETISHIATIIDTPIETFTKETDPSLNPEKPEIITEFSEIIEIKSEEQKVNEDPETSQKFESLEILDQSEKPQTLSPKSSHSESEVKDFKSTEESKTIEGSEKQDYKEEVTESKYEFIESSESSSIPHSKLSEDLPVSKGEEIQEESKFTESSQVPLESPLYPPESTNILNPVPEPYLVPLSYEDPNADLNRPSSPHIEKPQLSSEDPKASDSD